MITYEELTLLIMVISLLTLVAFGIVALALLLLTAPGRRRTSRRH